MWRFIVRRFLILIPTFFGITFFTFSLVRLIPGDVVEVMMGERGVDPAMHAAAMHRLGLDKPFLMQYVDYIGKVFQGDLGESFVTRISVLDEFMQLFPATLEMMFLSVLLVTTIGIVAGTIAAVKRGTAIDYGVSGLVLIFAAVPVFVWALLLIIVFSGFLHLLPVSGAMDVLFDIPYQTGFSLIDAWLAEQAEPNLYQGAFGDACQHIVLPVATLTLLLIAGVTRMTRTSMLETLNEPYIRTAKAKGLSSRRVIFVHALRNSLIPVITLIGLEVSALLGGAILTETIFAWPGVGKWMMDALSRRDYPIIQSGTLIFATLTILVNFIVDILYGMANPRISR